MSKRFGARLAVDGVSLQVAPGTVHAVVGENGAGKSTLLHLAAGTVRADAGELWLGAQRLDLMHHTPAAAIAAGLGMVHQHFMLVPTLTVVENVVLGREPRRGLCLDLRRAANELVALAERTGLAVDPWRAVAELSVGERQRVELLKVLWRGAQVLLLDEPTAVLAPTEVAALLQVLRTLAAAGHAVVLVTHKLDEVRAVAHAITVLRQGRAVAQLPGDCDPVVVARAMVGEGTALDEPAAWGGREVAMEAPAALRVDDLWVARDDGSAAVRGVSLALRPGEVLGVAGVQGNGQRELCEALLGVRPVLRGTLLLDGIQVTARSVRARLRHGLAYIADDRHHRSLIASLDLAHNALLGRQGELTHHGMLARAAVQAHGLRLLQAGDVQPAQLDLLASALSGGNQQKLVVARELDRPGLRVLVAVEPTRGVDVAAAAAIHQRLAAVAARGVAVLLVSSDLAELRRLARRIAVLYRGQLVQLLDVGAATDQALGPLMTGAGRAVEVRP